MYTLAVTPAGLHLDYRDGILFAEYAEGAQGWRAQSLAWTFCCACSSIPFVCVLVGVSLRGVFLRLSKCYSEPALWPCGHSCARHSVWSGRGVL